MRRAADSVISVSSLYRPADGTDLLARRAGEQKKEVNHNQVKSIRLTGVSVHEKFLRL